MTVPYSREFWKILRGLPVWQQVGFWVFNVGGVSYGSFAPFFETYRHAHVGWLWFLWISVLAFSVSTVLLVGQRTWEQVERERSDLERRLEPRLEFYFRPDCCLYRRARHLFMGVRNPTATTIANVLVRIDVPSAGTRGYLLPWSGYDIGESIQIDPSPPSFHHHLVLAEAIEISGKRKLRMAHLDFDHHNLDIGEHEISISVTGTDIPPTVARAVIGISLDGVMTLRPLPDYGTGGWARQEA